MKMLYKAARLSILLSVALLNGYCGIRTGAECLADRIGTYYPLYICDKTPGQDGKIVLSRNEFTACDHVIRVTDDTYTVTGFILVLLYSNASHKEIQITGNTIPSEHMSVILDQCKGFYIEKAAAENKEHKMRRLYAANVVLQ